MSRIDSVILHIDFSLRQNFLTLPSRNSAIKLGIILGVSTSPVFSDTHTEVLFLVHIVPDDTTGTGLRLFFEILFGGESKDPSKPVVGDKEIPDQVPCRLRTSVA